MTSLPSGFRDMLVDVIGADGAATLVDALGSPASVSARLNPLKVPSSDPFPDSTAVPWSKYGRLLPERPVFTLDPLMHAGAYYVQDSSAMFPGWAFRQVLPALLADAGDRPLRVLDLCAAPGGKTTDLAASLREACGDRFLLVANEVVSQRAGVLADNVAIWGDPNVVVTSVDPGAFASLPGFFDAVIADVPCSGEGMFRKDAKAVRDWSPATVDLCCSRQRRIVSDVWPALRGGGAFIYSTCTFNRSEDDGNAEWFMENLGASRIELKAGFEGIIPTGCGFLLAPGFVPGEGQWCCAMLKTGSSQNAYAVKPPKRSRDAAGAYADMLDRPATVMRRGADLLVAVPDSIAAEAAALEALHPIQTGVALGSLKGGALVPSEDLILNHMLRDGVFPCVETDRGTALAYLHRDSFRLPDAPRGLITLSFSGLRYGVVKNLGSRCNNLRPLHKRVLMDVNI
ncbi:MAG: rRNA cytosine-C5-methyltransferase [Bacteroidales bacterium]|nr:rRNA cytosine-C5-methyltransferase [Bacteroidales bacterium]